MKGSVETLRGLIVTGRSCRVGGGRLIGVRRPIPAPPPMGGSGVLIAMGPSEGRGRVGENGGERAVPLPLPSAPFTSSSDEACGDFLTLGRPLLGPLPLLSAMVPSVVTVAVGDLNDGRR